jgi:hypothetical protein
MQLLDVCSFWRHRRCMRREMTWTLISRTSQRSGGSHSLRGFTRVRVTQAGSICNAISDLAAIQLFQAMSTGGSKGNTIFCWESAQSRAPKARLLTERSPSREKRTTSERRSRRISNHFRLRLVINSTSSGGTGVTLRWQRKSTCWTPKRVSAEK